MRIGIIGTNFISEWFVRAARLTNGRIEPHAVYSRTQARASEFASQQGITRAFDSLDRMIDAVDAVYVASPTSAHFPQAMAAIEAGRHVLVEKTMTASHAEAAELFDHAQERGVVVMEASRHIHGPEYAIIRDAIARLGTVRQANFEMLQYSSRYDRFRAGERMNAFDPTLGNSALADIGIYPLEAALFLFGTPSSHSGSSVWLGNGFEGAGGIQLDYGQMLAHVSYSKITQGYTPSTIVGEDGALTIDSLALPTQISLHASDGESVLLSTSRPHSADGMVSELISFADHVERGATDPRWRDVTLMARRIMDEHFDR